MSQPRLTVIGASGRMGREILALAHEMGFPVTAGVSRKAHALLSGELQLKSVERISDVDSSATDVVVDFSMPENTSEVLRWCVQNSKALVSGVTGLSESDRKLLQQASAKIAVLWAPNMSLGIAVMARMLAGFKSLEDFEFQIEELHHKRKKDSPSGTALFLQSKLTSIVGRAPEPVAIRGGGIFGIHKAWAMGEEETLTIEHTAMNRRVFARGALRAASWIVGRPAGLYCMDDAL
jgi:4-hydroxy-tetrahydrodipicolinate reductase